MENNPKAQVIERLKEAQNILVTVSNDPTVDQLSAAIGFTLMMNKLNKHATAVFSGMVPSTLEFLKPEETLEQTTDSLRDFIISLDKSKADKLRYKVEEDVVRIFITPYKTNLSEDDLEFSQGDFNVDVVVALGVDQREHIDQAIMSHGRILHDATVIGVMAGNTPIDVGGINWQEPNASSLCEMLVGTSESFQKGLLDNQMATAFLTGIVAETDRFSNDKTSPKVMTMSAQLMAAGANQQLIATQLVEPPEVVDPIEEYTFEELPAVVEDEPEAAQTNDNEGVISLHNEYVPEPAAEEPELEAGPEQVILSEPAPAYEEPVVSSKNPVDQIHIDNHGTLHQADSLGKLVDNLQISGREANFNRGKVVEPLTDAEKAEEPGAPHVPLSSYLTEPPAMGGTLTASSVDESTEESQEQSSDPLSNIPQTSYPAPSIPVVQDYNQPLIKPDLPPISSQPEQPAQNNFDIDSILKGVSSESIDEPAQQQTIVSPANPTQATPAQFNIDNMLGKPLGPSVEATDTLEDIESSVTQFSGEPVHGSALDQDAARKAVFEATNANGGFDPNRPGALASSGASYVPLNSEPQPQTNLQPEYKPTDDEPPEVPPPFPMPPTNGTMPLPN